MTKKKGFNMVNTTKEFVGSGIILGVGSSALGTMGQGEIAGKVITPAANMIGPMASASYGMGIMKMFSDNTPKSKRSKGGI